MTGGILAADSAVFTGVATPVFPTSTSGPEASLPEPQGIIPHFSTRNTWRDAARSGVGGGRTDEGQSCSEGANEIPMIEPSSD